MARKKTNVCLIPGCNQSSKHRGQCESCYKSSLRLVNKGVTTWSELESRGLTNPAKKPGRRPTPAFEAITGGVKNTKINKSTKKRPVKK